MTSPLRKLLRFTTIYGPARAYNKAIGRLRPRWAKKIYLLPAKAHIGIIGCGQFAFSCIAFFLARQKGKVIQACFDIKPEHQQSLAQYYGATETKNSLEVIQDPKVDTLYIASNHASHTPYAVQAMEQGIRTIYMEKPIAVTWEQYQSLIDTQTKTNTTLYAGYNRPYSQAIRQLKTAVLKDGIKDTSFTINYFISGHLIPEDHWYRIPEEGTRICGNVGHWLDLSIHILSWRALPNMLEVTITYSHPEEFDDNITIQLTSEKGDLISILLTARSEPFEGINESINFQYGDTIAKIDDFRQMTIWQREKRIRKRYWPKDVGHKRAVMQPFHSDNRNWEEVRISTRLMLFITDMVRQRQGKGTFEVEKEATLPPSPLKGEILPASP